MSVSLLETHLGFSGWRSSVGSDHSLSDPPIALRGAHRAEEDSVLDDREDVLLGDDEELLPVDLELRAGVLGVEDLVADLHVDGLALAVIEDPARAHSEDLALLRLLLGG